MKRCAICDYLEGHGSEALGLPNNNQRVIWNPRHREYQCQECYDDIKEVEHEFRIEDENKALNEISEDQSALPEVPVE